MNYAINKLFVRIVLLLISTVFDVKIYWKRMKNLYVNNAPEIEDPPTVYVSHPKFQSRKIQIAKFVINQNIMI